MPADVAWLVLGAPLGWLASDAASGLVHWWADRLGREDLPLLGPHFVRPFREHHEAPWRIWRGDFATTNGNNCLVALPVLGLGLCVLPEAPRGAGLAAFSAFLFFVLGVCLTNQIHRWAHQPRVSRVVAWLQRRRLILPRRHHAAHHAPPHTAHYCITTGWLDSLLEGCGLFATLERRLRPDAARRRPRSGTP